MRPFQFARAEDPASALAARRELMPAAPPRNAAAVHAPAQYLAGGTTLIDLMKLDVMRPELAIDINAMDKTKAGEIQFGAQGLRLGALVRMSAAADHPDIKTNIPVISQSLALAASAQIRNMASLGGNVLQRTRCTYFRDTSYAECNKRNPGSGCAALKGINRMHAVLGTSDRCIASYPGDFAQALIALDAQVEIASPQGVRIVPFAALHRAPGDSPQVETILAPGELITAFVVNQTPWMKRSLYLKIRDRDSYEFALASAAVALNMDGPTVREARIALGGVAATPWRSKEAEAALKGQRINDAALKKAADAAFAKARPMEHNAFKVELGKLTMIRALKQAAAMEV